MINGVTDTRFVVSDWLKGADAQGARGITVRQTGGTMDGKQYVVEGDPIVTLGDRAVLYLERTPGDRYAVLGGPTGRLTIQRDGTVVKLQDTSLTEQLPRSVSDVVQTTKKAVAGTRSE